MVLLAPCYRPVVLVGFRGAIGLSPTLAHATGGDEPLLTEKCLNQQAVTRRAANKLALRNQINQQFAYQFPFENYFVSDFGAELLDELLLLSLLLVLELLELESDEADFL